MLWAVLLQSEYRRVKRAVLDLARTNPIILVAIVAVAAGFVALAVRSADFFALLSIVPGGLSGFSILLLLVGSVTGYTFSLTLPKEKYFDEQFRLTTVRPIEMLAGLRGLPLLLVVGVTAVPFVAMMWRVYALVTVPAPGVWAGVFALLYLTAALQGAAVSEVLRGCRSWRLFAIASSALAGTLAMSFLASSRVEDPWYWLATYLPAASIDSDGFAIAIRPVVYVAAAAAAVSAALSVTAWTAYSLRPDPPMRRRRVAFSVPIGTGPLTAFPAWAMLTILRQGESRGLLALTFLTGIGATALLSRWPHSGTVPVLVLLTSTLTLLLTAVVVLTFSEDRFAGSWLIKTVPTSGTLIGLAWWITVSVLTAAIGSLAVGPSIVGFSEGGGYIASALLLIAYASSTTIVGLLLPWSRQSPFRQLVATVALIAGASVAYYVVQSVAQLGTTLGSDGMAVVTSGLLLLVVAGALSVTIESLGSRSTASVGPH